MQHDEEKLSKREQAVQRQLNSVVEKYAEAIELFEAWEAQRWKDAAAVTKGLEGKSISEQLRLLRLQIEMRTIGCGWREFETKWGFFGRWGAGLGHGTESHHQVGRRGTPAG